MMRKMFFIPVLLIITLFQVQAQRQYFERDTFVRWHDTLFYRFEFPANYNGNEKYPLILFLHGAGERGSDNEKQLTYIDKIFGSDEFREKYPCFVVAPQCPEGKRWVEVDWSLKKHTIPKQMSEPMLLTISLLDELVKAYNIDTTRIYVTGLSMGGFGTWDIIARFPDKFAAAIPICGGADEQTAERIKDIPVWVFHGTKDKLVPVSRSRNMVEALKKAGGNPKYTEFPDKGHFAWNAAYATPGLWDWLFQQKK